MLKKKNTEKTIDNILKEISKCIILYTDKIKLFEDVKAHILKGGSATGIVWEYSPYLNIEQVDELLNNLNERLTIIKQLYGELLIYKELKAIDKDLIDYFKSNMQELNSKNISEISNSIELLKTKATQL